ncbi:ABC transporter substrate-binding protein [Aurantibacter sp.]|uniref:ABC transporter substrate-binding protein n=1 Tax=Aurantibacter sp. TaxID=2807103 RepID=UPI0032639070
MNTTFLKNQRLKFITKNSKILGVLVLVITLYNCNSTSAEVINIGYIGPLSTRATDLGIPPANAMKLAVEQYNKTKHAQQPQINLYMEDDKWKMENAIPAYQKLKAEHDIKVLFISNTDGTMAVQNNILKDGVIAVNPLNSDDLLSTTNENTFRIAKKTEEANGIIAIRIIELGLKKVLFLQYPNDFMTRATNAAIDILKEANVAYKVVTANIGAVDFKEEMAEAKEEGFDALVFFGYKEFGYAMKQARDAGITAPFFGSTVLLDPEYYDNSEGAIVGTECCYFTPADGNFVLANKFIEQYEDMYNKKPTSVWPAMQAYDAMNLVLNQLGDLKDGMHESLTLSDMLRDKMKKVRYYQGVCGNLLIAENGSSKGIYFSLYQYESKGNLVQVRR